jgi:FlaA1/EpsC-like NDP-sugar epimerase
MASPDEPGHLRAGGAIQGREGEMNISFAGRVVLVAGGTGGLGRAVSLAFLD